MLAKIVATGLIILTALIFVINLLLGLYHAYFGGLDFNGNVAIGVGCGSLVGIIIGFLVLIEDYKKEAEK